MREHSPALHRNRMKRAWGNNEGIEDPNVCENVPLTTGRAKSGRHRPVKTLEIFGHWPEVRRCVDEG